MNEATDNRIKYFLHWPIVYERIATKNLVGDWFVWFSLWNNNSTDMTEI